MNIKDKLADMSDMELHNLICAVCAAAGFDVKKTEQLTSDIPRLRRMLGALSDKQISGLLASLGTQDASEMLRMIGGG